MAPFFGSLSISAMAFPPRERSLAGPAVISSDPYFVSTCSLYLSSDPSRLASTPFTAITVPAGSCTSPVYNTPLPAFDLPGMDCTDSEGHTNCFVPGLYFGTSHSVGNAHRNSAASCGVGYPAGTYWGRVRSRRLYREELQRSLRGLSSIKCCHQSCT
jgi:hypothetical protein